MSVQLFAIISSIILITATGYYATFTHFNKLECETYDRPFADFKECKLRAMGRGLVSLNIYVQLFRVPINNVTINASLWRKSYGYRQLLYNQTTDFCLFMSNRNPDMSFVKVFLNMLEDVSNINHSCPYDHAIIVKDMIILEEYLAIMQLPGGDYKFNLKVAAYNDWKASVTIYLLRKK